MRKIVGAPVSWESRGNGVDRRLCPMQASGKGTTTKGEAEKWQATLKKQQEWFTILESGRAVLSFLSLEGNLYHSRQ